ncbi:MAG TPA: polysaccharide deacetylase family protein [Hyalangium sp.]|nr:polysaccharide deacetylase family protein [Hyalangium sp.]
MPSSTIYLTFSDSPDTACPGILDALKSSGAKATFFLQSGRMKADIDYHALIKRMVKEGHTLGVSLSYAKTPLELVQLYSSNLEAFKKLFQAQGDTFPGFKLARMSGSNLTDNTYLTRLSSGEQLSHIRWNFELAPTNKLAHLTAARWQGLDGIYASAQGLPADKDIVLLHSPHWKDNAQKLTQVLAKLAGSFKLAPLEPLPLNHAKITYASTEKQKPRIYLTFDDGPKPITDSVIDTLDELGLNATFFLNMLWMNGNRDEQYRILSKMLKGGHFLASHGYDHDPAEQAQYTKEYTATGTASVKKDFEENSRLIQELFSAHHDKSFTGFAAARLPGNGSFFSHDGQKVFVNMITQELKLPHVGWNFEFFPNGTFVSRKPRISDWMQIKGVAAESSTHSLPQDGHIVLLHEHHWDASSKSRGTLAQLKELLKKLQQETTVTPLFPLPKPHSKIQFSST